MQEARQEAARQWYHRTEVTMHRSLQFLVGGGQPYHCTAGDSLITVQPNGDVYPCRRLPIRVGNLMETPLAELYYSSDLLCALRDRNCVSQGCEACYFARLCRGGLKCLVLRHCQGCICGRSRMLAGRESDGIKFCLLRRGSRMKTKCPNCSAVYSISGPAEGGSERSHDAGSVRKRSGFLR